MRMGIGLGVGINRSNYAQGIFNAYSARVVADGGVVEGGSCVDAVSSLLQSASLLLIPSGYKGGKLYAEIPTNGNGDLTWTRGSDAFRTNASGVLQRVPWNLLQYSEDFSNGVWSKTASSISANATTAPNGTLTADALIEDTTNALHVCGQSITLNSSICTVSIYAKPNGRNWMYISMVAASNYGTYFDLQNGALGTVESNVTATITNVGNGWYRCTITTNSAVSSARCQVYPATANGVNAYTGNGTSGLFIWGAQLVEGTSAQTYLPTTDRLNFPRLSYMYGSCPSVLLEPQRTNLITWSEDLTNADWIKAQATASGNNTTAPDGNNTADKLIINNGAAGGYAYQAKTTTSGTIYTGSFYVKAGGVSFTKFHTNISGSYQNAVINLSTGAITNSSFATTPTSTSVGNGWYRVSYTVTSGGGNVVIYIDGGCTSTGGTYTGNGTDGIFVWGFQSEIGSYPTTYIPTTSATATRVADSFSRNNIYTNGLISASGGTWFVELRGNVAYTRDGFGALYLGTQSLTTSTTGDGLYIRRNDLSSNRLNIQSYISGVATALYLTTTDTVKIALKWNGTSVDVFVNGTKQVSASAFTPTAMEFLGHSTIVDVPKFIQQMALFPSALTDTQCQTLTT